MRIHIDRWLTAVTSIALVATCLSAGAFSPARSAAAGVLASSDASAPLLEGTLTGSPPASPAAASSPTRSPAAEPATVLAAGDIAGCSSDGDTATAEILGANDGTILALGDLAYGSGTAEQFANCYAPTWGSTRTEHTPFLAITSTRLRTPPAILATSARRLGTQGGGITHSTSEAGTSSHSTPIAQMSVAAELAHRRKVG